jgi:pimeloyl-ACP methyl ester carboxylesterase
MKMTTIKFNSADNVEVTADLYQHENKSAPVLLLCHQAGYSRGEYIETVPKLLSMGFSCLALDQRSGNEVNGVLNQTARFAHNKNLPLKYVDAVPDIEAGIHYLTQHFPASKKIILGSSYSSSLALIMAVKFGDVLAGAISFSPGEYFLYDNNVVSEWAAQIKIPTFFTSSKGELHSWQRISEATPEAYRTIFHPVAEGRHGSKTLWEETSNHKEYWDAINQFLNKYKN